MKKVIRLTESDLHRIVRNSVNRILSENYEEEGQGYNTFKTLSREILSGDRDDELPYLGSQEWKNERNNFIQHGSGNGYDHDFYDEKGNATDNPEGNQPMNRGLGGKIGRAASAYALQGLGKARQSYNKMRGR